MSLPLVLPPSVLGFYLLVALGANPFTAYLSLLEGAFGSVSGFTRASLARLRGESIASSICAVRSCSAICACATAWR